MHETKNDDKGSKRCYVVKGVKKPQIIFKNPHDVFYEKKTVK